MCAHTQAYIYSLTTHITAQCMSMWGHIPLCVIFYTRVFQDIPENEIN